MVEVYQIRDATKNRPEFIEAAVFLFMDFTTFDFID